MNRQSTIRELSRHLVPVLDMRRGFPGPSLWTMLADFACDGGLGGVLLRGGDRATWHEAIDRLSGLGAARPRILADFEQGAASQICNVPWLPKQFSVGATQDPNDAERFGRLVGRQAQEFGVDLVLAPVADLYIEPGSPVTGARCFGATPSRVAQSVAAFIRGCQDEGAGAVAKHFPGHGRTAEDSHVRMPSISVRRDRWFVSDCLPFREAIHAHAAGIMVGHLWMNCLDPFVVRPASLSPVIMREILRNELGFDGLILTDSFEMSAIADGGIDTAQGAVESGADLVIGPRIRELMGTLPSAGGPLREERGDIDHSGDYEADRSFSLEIARRSVAWIGNETVLSDDRDRSMLTVLLPTDERGARQAVQVFLREVVARTPGCIVRQIIGRDGDDFAGRFVVIVVVAKWERQLTYRALRDIISRVAATAAHVVVILFGAVDTATLSRGLLPTILCGDGTIYSQTVAAHVLFGEERARGFPDLPSHPEVALADMGGSI